MGIPYRKPVNFLAAGAQIGSTLPALGKSAGGVVVSAEEYARLRKRDDFIETAFNQMKESGDLPPDAQLPPDLTIEEFEEKVSAYKAWKDANKQLKDTGAQLVAPQWGANWDTAKKYMSQAEKWGARAQQQKGQDIVTEAAAQEKLPTKQEVERKLAQTDISAAEQKRLAAGFDPGLTPEDLFRGQLAKLKLKANQKGALTSKDIMNVKAKYNTIIASHSARVTALEQRRKQLLDQGNDLVAEDFQSLVADKAALEQNKKELARIEKAEAYYDTGQYTWDEAMQKARGVKGLGATFQAPDSAAKPKVKIRRTK